MLFGFAFALAVLARYVALWLIPVFVAYLLLKHKNLNFLKEKAVIISIIIFLATLSPWLYYGLVEYGNPFGPLLHAQQSPYYWGLHQEWYYYFELFPQMFSAVMFLFFIGFYFMVRRFDIKKYNSLIVLSWFAIIFLFSAFVLPHQEERYLLPLVPALCMIAGNGLDKMKKHKNEIFVAVMLLTFATSSAILYGYYYDSNNTKAECYVKSLSFVNGLEDNLLIFTNDSPIFYYYTLRENHFLPKDYENMIYLIDNFYGGRTVYYFWHENDGIEELKNEIEKNSYEIIFECPQPESMMKIYKIR